VTARSDRFCRLCRFEVRRSGRIRLGRFWPLAALIPIIAGISYGAAVSGHMPFSATVRHTSATPPAGNTLATKALGLRVTVPSQWTTVDYSRSRGPSAGARLVVSTKSRADQAAASRALGDLVQAHTVSTALSIERIQPPASSVRGEPDPLTLLSAEVDDLTAAPTTGGPAVRESQQMREVAVGGHAAASVTLEVVRDGSAETFERTLVLAPSPGLPPIVRIDAVARPAAWDRGDGSRIQAAMTSLRFR
jgi:hypothetical protein